jgi:hypothetical protein
VVMPLLQVVLEEVEEEDILFHLVVAAEDIRAGMLLVVNGPIMALVREDFPTTQAPIRTTNRV